MEHMASISVTPLQVLFALVFQVWFIVFPIIVIRKLNYITALLQEQYQSSDKEAS